MLSEKERLSYCKTCQKRTFDTTIGLVCSLTNAKPTFEENCEDYLLDPKVKAQPKVKVKTEEEKKEDRKGILLVIFLILGAIIFSFIIYAINRWVNENIYN